MLVIETIDGLTTIAPAAEPHKVWVFPNADEARVFIQAWWSGREMRQTGFKLPGWWWV